MRLKQTLITSMLFGMTAPAIAQDAPILGYDLYGSGPEKVIVTHNWMGDASSFDAARPWLDTNTFTYAFIDIRGYGASRGIAGAYTSDEVAGDILALADHLGWERFHLVGHSMNGMAGFKTILRDWQGARRIKSFVAVTPVTPDGYPASDDDRAFLSAAIDDDETARMAFAGLTGGKLNARWGSVMTEEIRNTVSVQVLRGYYAMWLDEDFASALTAAEVKTPVLVIGGRNDLSGFQEAHYQQTIARWLPNIAFAYITDAGHYPMLETPVRFASLVEEHLMRNK